MAMLTTRLGRGPLTIGGVLGWSRKQGRGTWHGVALVLLVILSVGLGRPAPALAQVGGGLYWQCVPGDPSKVCPVSLPYPLPQGPAVNAMVPVAGTQVGVVVTSSTGLTIPAGATVALVQGQGTNNTSGQCLFWRDDGTAPTTSAGQAVPAYTNLWISTTAGFKMIQAASASCTATISYYK